MSENPTGTDSSELIDALFRVLSDERRRCVLYYLAEQESTTVEKLATVLTGWLRAREDPVEMATPDDRKRMRIALHHVHLPQIADEGFVRYDYESGTVALGDVPDLLETVLEHSLARERAIVEERDSETDRFPPEDP